MDAVLAVELLERAESLVRQRGRKLPLVGHKYRFYDIERLRIEFLENDVWGQLTLIMSDGVRPIAATSFNPMAFYADGRPDWSRVCKTAYIPQELIVYAIDVIRRHMVLDDISSI